MDRYDLEMKSKLINRDAQFLTKRHVGLHFCGNRTPARHDLGIALELEREQPGRSSHISEL